MSAGDGYWRPPGGVWQWPAGQPPVGAGGQETGAEAEYTEYTAIFLDIFADPRPSDLPYSGPGAHLALPGGGQEDGGDRLRSWIEK